MNMPITSKLSNALTPDQSDYIIKMSKGFDWMEDSGHNEYYLFFPLIFENKEKNPLKIRWRTKTSITGTNVTDLQTLVSFADYANWICGITVKRGKTIAYEYLENTLGFEYLDKISLYLQTMATHNVKAYKKDNTIVIITNLDTAETKTRIFSAIPLLFKANYNWSDELIAYFKAFNDDPTNETAYNLFMQYCINHKIFENIAFEKLKEIIERLSTRQIKTYKEQETRFKNDINSYEETLKRLYKDLLDIQAKITFYQPDMNLNEIATYISKNPYVTDYYAYNDEALALAIEAPLEYIDVTAFKKMLGNPAAFIYPRWGGDFPQPIIQHEEEFLRMLKDLFLSEKYKIYTRAEIVLDFKSSSAYPLTKAGDRIKALRPAIWELSERVNKTEKAITPHMHIEYYDCWSGNKANIAKCLVKNDIIGAIDIAVTTVKDINVNDGTVFARFLKDGLYAPKGYRTTQFQYTTNPSDQFKTIFDVKEKRFRTFADIFYNDYVKENMNQTDLDESFDDILELL